MAEHPGLGKETAPRLLPGAGVIPTGLRVSLLQGRDRLLRLGDGLLASAGRLASAGSRSYRNAR